MSAGDRATPWLARTDWAARAAAPEGAGLVQDVDVAYLAIFVLLMAVVSWLMDYAFAHWGRWVGAGTVMTYAMAILAAAMAIWGFAKLLERVRQLPAIYNRRPYRCRLETLPGVIGGWFKAEVEADLENAPEIATVSLLCVDERGDEPSVEWHGAYRLLGKDLHLARPGCFRIPARFKVPKKLEGHPVRKWQLSVLFTFPGGLQRGGVFGVPVFKTDQAPVREQYDEPGYDPDKFGGAPATLKLTPRGVRPT